DEPAPRALLALVEPADLCVVVHEGSSPCRVTLHLRLLRGPPSGFAPGPTHDGSSGPMPGRGGAPVDDRGPSLTWCRSRSRDGGHASAAWSGRAHLEAEVGE